MKSKTSKIKNIIFKDYQKDGDYWSYFGNSLIYEILDTFNKTDWNYLKEDLITWKDFEHSIFSRAILDYDAHRIVDEVDVYEIFFTEFVLQTDLDDADCQLQDLMCLQGIKKPNLLLLEQIKEKIKILSNYKLTIHSKENFEKAEQIVEDVISKIHYR